MHNEFARLPVTSQSICVAQHASNQQGLLTMTALIRVAVAAWNGNGRDELRRLVVETEGQDIIEYALVTTFIGFAGAAAWDAMQTGLGAAYAGFNDAVWDLWAPDDPVGGGS
jgi:hypothetical protein